MLTDSLLERQTSIDVVKTGRYMFALAMIAFGIENFIFGDFVVGRAPAWPAGIPGKLAWAYVSGAVFIVAGLMVIIKRKGRWASIILGLVIMVWALLRHVPLLITDLQWGAELTNAGKALTLFGGAFAVAASLLEEDDRLAGRFYKWVNANNKFILLGRFCLGIFMVISGIEHFIFDQFVQSLVPGWIPGKLFWTYFAGIALIAGGIGLFIKNVAPLSALMTGVMIFLWFILLHIPRAMVAGNDGNEWIAVVESFAFSGIAFVLIQGLKKGI
jgi:uncharacterized membrane protein